MSPPPVFALILLASGLLLCRPWLEARRPLVSLGLLFGTLIGWAAGGAAAEGWLDGATASAAAALPAGWLALWTGVSWDPQSPRTAGSGGRGWMPAALPILLGGAVLAAGRVSAPAVAALVAAASLALDPAAARRSLERVSRPGPGARQGPRFVSFWLGVALAGTALLAGFRAGDTGNSFSLWPVAGSFALGLCTGAAGIAMCRAAQGNALLLTVTASIVVTGVIASRWLGLSTLAALFTAGAVMARDTTRRDLVATVLGGMETPAAVLLSIAAGAWGVTAVAGTAWSEPSFLLAAAALGVAAPLGWRALPLGDVRSILPLPMALPAAVFAMEAALGGDAAIRAAAAGAIVAVAAGEIVWLAWGAGAARNGGTARA